MEEATECGMTKREAAHLFGANPSLVERHARSATEGKPLAPKKRLGSRPKADQTAGRLIEEDLRRRLAFSLADRRGYLGVTVGR